MAYIFITLLLWIVFIFLVCFKQKKEYYPTLLFSALFSLVSDLFGVTFSQWLYYGPTVSGLSLWSVLGIAPVEGGLFIIIYPRKHTWFIKIGYLFCWALLNTAGEWFFVQAGWLQYIQWDSLRAFLFYLFFFGAVWLQEYWYNGTGRLR